VPEGFVKFPRTPHLTWLGAGSPRGDKLLASDEAESLLRRRVAVEEKIDGACIGFSIDAQGMLRAQSRGSYIVPGLQQQFQPLWRWIAEREERLRPALGAGLILFGEWCYARHTVGYDRLPDWFLAFDIYDRHAARFWARSRRDDLAAQLGCAIVPLIAEGVFEKSALAPLMGVSRVGSEPMEGIYLRADDGSWLEQRAKLVRATWVQADEGHWSRRPLAPNQLAKGEPQQGREQSK